jgi:putative protease
MENNSNTNLPEILAPAGDLETALCAYDAGADAVYLGMADFSARGAAVNFTLSDLKRLKYEALLLEKKIYVTINTVVKENEIKKLVELLCELELICVDAVIVQDIGVLRLIREQFPTLEVHASTQMAVSDLRGLKELHSLGVKRAIVPRETTLSELTALSKESPIELETFIHGAMCYSHSGNCLASGLLLGRSGNRGKCAQVCRNYFDFYGENIYPFSCNDMSLEKDIVKLRELGVSSFKIEGRLKSKEY